MATASINSVGNVLLLFDKSGMATASFHSVGKRILQYMQRSMYKENFYKRKVASTNKSVTIFVMA